MKPKQPQHLSHWMYRVANHDFCPSWNWLTDWLKQPLGWVVCAIAFSLLIGLMIGPQGYMLAAAFLALLVLGLSWPWLSMKGIRCETVLPDCRVEENEELEIAIRIKNFWPLPVFGLMIQGDFLQDDSDQEEPIAFALKHLKPLSESEFRISVTPRRRGELPTGDVTIASGFPFGLMDISKQVNVSRRTLVWPSSTPLEGFPVSVSTRLCLQGALCDLSGDDGDSIGVRGYRHGDRLRNIHWAQSARSQRLIVRERQTISSTGVAVVLDLSPDDHSGAGIDSSYEWTIRIAASICSHLHAAHSPVRVVCFGLPAQTSEDNRKGVRPIMDFLAKLPTFADARNLTDPVNTNDAQQQQLDSIYQPKFSSNASIFLIGSTKSTQFKSGGLLNRGAKVVPVVVDVDSFEIQDELSGVKKSTPTNESNLRNNGSISVRTPQSAAEELASGWDRSFTDAI